ncbi:MAG: TIR domain-containing protein, partial [Myxococcota bacterium]
MREPDLPDPSDRASLLLVERRDRWRWLARRRDVFISYAHAQTSAYASNLRAALLEAGVSCYLDDVDFHEGHSLTKTAVTQIGRSRLLLRIEVAGETNTYWMDLEREVARQQGLPTATISLGGGPSDPDEIAFVDDLGEEPSADVVVAIVRRFVLRRWRRGRVLTALALFVAGAGAAWGLTTPLVAARSLDEVDEARLDEDWPAAADALLGIPGRQRSRVWLRYANEVLIGFGTQVFVTPPDGERMVPATSVIGILPDERRLQVKRGPAQPPPPDGTFAVATAPQSYLGHPRTELRLGSRVLSERCWDAGMFGDEGLWAVTGAVYDSGEVEAPVLGVIEPRGGAGVWRHTLAGDEPWRVLGSGDGDWVWVLQPRKAGETHVVRHHLHSGQTESVRWPDASASWFLGRCATLDGPSLVTCDDGTIARIDFETGRPLASEPLSNRAAEAMAFGPGGRRAVVGAGRLDVRDGRRSWGARFET